VLVTDVLSKNSLTHRDAVWGLTIVGPRNHASNGGQDRTNPFAAAYVYISGHVREPCM